MFNKLKFLSKMKKIKLFALAAFAMLSTNAFAAPGDISYGTIKSTDTFTYQPELIEGDGGATSPTGNAKITGFVNGLTAAQMETLTIPAQIVGDGDVVYKVTAVDGNAGTATKFAGNANIKKVVVAGNSNLTEIVGASFEGCSALTEIDLANAAKLAKLGAKALAGTSIVTLDLSKTVVTDLSTFEFNDADADDDHASLRKNITLTTLILWDQWSKIGAKAFTNCTALKTVNFQTANPTWLHYVTDATQTITGKAFANTAIEDLDLSGTILTTLDKMTFNPLNAAGTAIVENKALKTVKLNATITALNGNFSYCTSLTSIDIENDAALTTLKDKEFQYDAKLASIDLKNITTLENGDHKGHQFEGTALTEVTIPAAIKIIPESAFQDCASLAKLVFAHGNNDAGSFTGIETMAFAGDTKLTSFVLPVKMATTADAIAAKAFFMCSGLTEVTFKPAVEANITTKTINADAFLQCKEGTNKITLYTNAYLVNAYTAGEPAVVTPPACTKFDTGAAPSGDINTLDWTVTPYAKNANKFYVKVFVPATYGIKVKAVAGTKVYSAYIDQAVNAVASTDPLTMHMCEYKIIGGYYWIPAQDAALIITDNKDLTYEKQTADEIAGAHTSSSWTTVRTEANKNNAYVNQLVYLTTATSATTIAAGATYGKVIYGWVNAESVGTGWMNITSGTMPKGGLYVLAKKPAAGGRLNVVWEDADGNIVEEEATAIQTVKTAKAENGAIYNLAGQKVNAAYKGVVIKDGKKYIQK